MSASLRPLTVEEFLDWERRQPLKYEFDGIQPVAMTGGTIRHAQLVRNVVRALDARLKTGCEMLGGDVKVATVPNRVRYPDALVAYGPLEANEDVVEPVIVFEIVSPSSELVDRNVKALKYQGVVSIAAYVLLEQERCEVVVRRRVDGWAPRTLTAADAVVELPEVGAAVTLAELYRGAL